jgi:signal transduction histidine kinase
LARTGQAQHVDDLKARFGQLSCGEYPESLDLKEALALPITPPGCERPVGAGVRRLALNETYRSFYDLLAAAITTEVANALAYEEERKRAEALAEIDRAKTAFFSNVSHEFRSGRTVARSGLRMMPTFPPSPLSFRTAGFPQYG